MPANKEDMTGMLGSTDSNSWKYGTLLMVHYTTTASVGTDRAIKSTTSTSVEYPLIDLCKYSYSQT